ncbi:uncharacterized protein DEA37_0009059 [Paragonimus westermani]|uniref:Uncharacterized protein n=1 Tax=Paragonimus westermani TaxID=34504 RepID=A0A5J4NBT7_9TREM|nr:uncharacterized protein DEA37_0009059 [Paragonimus westermani]
MLLYACLALMFMMSRSHHVTSTKDPHSANEQSGQPNDLSNVSVTCDEKWSEWRIIHPLSIVIETNLTKLNEKPVCKRIHLVCYRQTRCTCPLNWSTHYLTAPDGGCIQTSKCALPVCSKLHGTSTLPIHEGFLLQSEPIMSASVRSSVFRITYIPRAGRTIPGTIMKRVNHLMKNDTDIYLENGVGQHTLKLFVNFESFLILLSLSGCCFLSTTAVLICIKCFIHKYGKSESLTRIKNMLIDVKHTDPSSSVIPYKNHSPHIAPSNSCYDAGRVV